MNELQEVFSKDKTDIQNNKLVEAGLQIVELLSMIK
jgi:hypothetical protein